MGDHQVQTGGLTPDQPPSEQRVQHGAAEDADATDSDSEMNRDRADRPAGGPRLTRSAARKRTLLILLIAISLSLGVARLNKNLSGAPRLADRLAMHQMVLDEEAYMPYQFHMYLAAHVSEWLQDRAGLSALASFDWMYRVGYTALFLSIWAMLATVYRRTVTIILGLFALAWFSALLIPCSYHHPTDPFGAALIALTLAATVRGSVAGVGLGSFAAGFLWSKQILVAPVIFLYEGLQARWGRGVALGALVAAAASVGSLVYGLPDNPITPEGVRSADTYLTAVPWAVKAHVGFAVPALLSLWVLRSRLPLIAKTAAIIYPLMLGIYALHGMFLYELRSFWPVVPVFVCLIAAWGEGAFEQDAESDAEPT
jgi:hypothetical protein